MREEYAEQGPDVVLSRPLCEALDARLGLADRVALDADLGQRLGQLVGQFRI